MGDMFENKPYDFVPLSSKCERLEKKSHKEFGESTYSGKLDLTIYATSPIVIGQGEYGIEGTRIYKAFMRRSGKVVIPGSSIKGVVRSVAEAVSYSCAPKTPRRNEAKFLESGNKESCSGKGGRLCPSCSIFGMTSRDLSYKSKVRFSEFAMDDANGNKRMEVLEMPSFHRPSKINSSEKFYGRKFYKHSKIQEKADSKSGQLYEAAAKGSSFKGEMFFENLSIKELKLVSYALGIGSHFNLKLGYAKPAYYGSVRFKVESAENTLRRYGIDGADFDESYFEQMAEEYRKEIQEGQDESLKKAVLKLEEILLPNSGPCWMSVRGRLGY